MTKWKSIFLLHSLHSIRLKWTGNTQPYPKRMLVQYMMSRCHAGHEEMCSGAVVLLTVWIIQGATSWIMKDGKKFTIWGWNEIFSYFNKSETFQAEGDEDYHGHNSPLIVTNITFSSIY